MIRVLIAAWLLRTTGANIAYEVRRISAKQSKGRGTIVLSSKRLKQARQKYAAMRIADSDTITITVSAVIAQRHGEIEANQ